MASPDISQDIIIGIATSLIASIIFYYILKYLQRNKLKPIIIKEIIFELTPFFKQSSLLRLSKINYFYGKNSTGKSAITEWLSALEDNSRIDRWQINKNILPINITLGLNIKKLNELRIKIESQTVQFIYQNITSVISPIPFKLIILKDTLNKSSSSDEIVSISQKLNTNKATLLEIINDFHLVSVLFIKDIEIRDENGMARLFVKINNNHEQYRPYAVLSTSEQQRVHIELGLRLGTKYAKSYHTLIVIEQSSFNIDVEYFVQLIQTLSNKKFPIQTILISVLPPFFDSDLDVNSVVFTGAVPNIDFSVL